ncbi:MAG TPA: MFS transporter [Actinospica sp.]|jgi:DHA2 family multidrug resistance protein-like MFS transporter|nr:MFS transporter [Actinospica sp.]
MTTTEGLTTEGLESAAGAGAKAGRREWTALGVLLLPLLLVSMDNSVLLYAVPFITGALHPSSTQQLWMYDVYGFVLAGLLITMGAMGDRIGRRRLLLIGAFCFSAASLGAAYAGNAGELVAARAIQGVAGATLMPSTLALIRVMFHDDGQRKKAIGIWTGGTMSGVMLGPVLSGLLLDHFWWGSVFLINLPFMVLLLALAPFLLPEYRAPRAGRFDLPGSALSFAAVLPVVYGISEIAENGVDGTRLGAIAFGLVTAVLFLWHEHRTSHPMVELALFRNRGYSGSLATCLLAMFAILGNAMFLTQYLQSVLGMSPLTAALWSLVPSLGVGAVIGVTGALAKRFDRAYVIAGCFVVVLAGYAVEATLLHADSHLWVLMVGAGLLACGSVGVMALGNELMLGALPVDRAGAGAAMNETVTELGGALGMAVMGSIGTAVYRHHLGGAGVPAAARSTLGGAIATAAHEPGAAGATLLSTARAAFSSGVNVVAFVGVGIAAGAAVLSVLVLRRLRAEEPAAEGERPGTGMAVAATPVAQPEPTAGALTP